MQFLRFALVVLLVVVGFGGGLCGLWGIAVSTESSSDRGIVLALSAVGLLVAVGCGFAIRALIRRMNRARPAGPQ